MIRVLHVEDSDDDADLLVFALTNANPDWTRTVVLARVRSFNEAVAEVKTNRPHLVILDLNLPGQSGSALLHRLKTHQDTCEIPVIILSTSNASHDITFCYRNYAASYLVKPDTFAGLTDLMAAIHQYWFEGVKYG